MRPSAAQAIIHIGLFRADPDPRCDVDANALDTQEIAVDRSLYLNPSALLSRRDSVCSLITKQVQQEQPSWLVC